MTEGQSEKGANPAPRISAEISGTPKLGTIRDSLGDLVSSEVESLDDTHAEFADFHQQYVSGYIVLADSKAALAFAIASSLLGYILGTEKLNSVLLDPQPSLFFVSLALTTGLLILSAALSFWVIVPRLVSSGEGIINFVSVAARKSAEEYVHDVALHTRAQMIRARLHHCYDISRVCDSKYRYLRFAIWFGFLGLSGTLMSLLMASAST